MFVNQFIQFDGWGIHMIFFTLRDFLICAE